MGVGAGLRLLSVLHIWETQRVNSRSSTLMFIGFTEPTDARHRTWFCEYKDDQD